MNTNNAELHRHAAARFTGIVDNVSDWDAPTPVKEWTARDVIGHLTTWFPEYLKAGGVDLPAGPSVNDDPAAAWRHQMQAVQTLLDGPDAEREFAHPMTGPTTLGAGINQFYTSDVVFHSWDLARSAGQDFEIDHASEIYEGMSAVEDGLRASGQFGTRVEVPDDASAQDKLLGLIGRDPYWEPPS